MQFTVFYDGACPLCSIEVNHLKKRNLQNRLSFVDISTKDFTTNYPELDWEAMDKKIHGQLSDGTWLTGLDVTHKAWSLVGKGWLYAPLRWPVISWFADKFYLWFARHRHQIASFLTGKNNTSKDQRHKQSSCETSCETKLK